MDPVGVAAMNRSGLGDLAVLPDALICFILFHLEIRDVLASSQASHLFRVFALEEPLWTHLCLRQCGGRLSFQGTWRQTAFTALCLAGHSIPEAAMAAAVNPPAPVPGFDSQFLYRRWYRCHANLSGFVPLRQDLLVVDGKQLGPQDVLRQFDEPCLPTLLGGLAEGWSGGDWQFDSLVARLGSAEMKVSTPVVPVAMSLSAYADYVAQQHDEEPLYIFDDGFAQAAPQFLSMYQVPGLFDQDLLAALGESARPPYRWLVIGPARSGASWHVDPYLTNAWNTLLQGRKRWALYPPDIVPPGLIRCNDGEGQFNSDDNLTSLQWFLEVYPLLLPAQRPIEFCQAPGETVFVPGGWWHCVLNLDQAQVAVTQNFVSTANLGRVAADMARGTGWYHDHVREQYAPAVVAGWRELERACLGASGLPAAGAVPAPSNIGACLPGGPTSPTAMPNCAKAKGGACQPGPDIASDRKCSSGSSGDGSKPADAIGNSDSHMGWDTASEDGSRAGYGSSVDLAMHVLLYGPRDNQSGSASSGSANMDCGCSGRGETCADSHTDCSPCQGAGHSDGQAVSSNSDPYAALQAALSAEGQRYKNSSITSRDGAKFLPTHLFQRSRVLGRWLRELWHQQPQLRDALQSIVHQQLRLPCWHALLHAICTAASQPQSAATSLQLQMSLQRSTEPPEQQQQQFLPGSATAKPLQHVWGLFAAECLVQGEKRRPLTAVEEGLEEEENSSLGLPDVLPLCGMTALVWLLGDLTIKLYTEEPELARLTAHLEAYVGGLTGRPRSVWDRARAPPLIHNPSWLPRAHCLGTVTVHVAAKAVLPGEAPGWCRNTCRVAPDTVLVTAPAAELRASGVTAGAPDRPAGSSGERSLVAAGGSCGHGGPLQTCGSTATGAAYPFLVSERVAGLALREALPAMHRRAQLATAEALGRLLAEWHLRGAELMTLGDGGQPAPAAEPAPSAQGRARGAASAGGSMSSTVQAAVAAAATAGNGRASCSDLASPCKDVTGRQGTHHRDEQAAATRGVDWLQLLHRGHTLWHDRSGNIWTSLHGRIAHSGLGPSPASRNVSRALAGLELVGSNARGDSSHGAPHDLVAVHPAPWGNAADSAGGASSSAQPGRGTAPPAHAAGGPGSWAHCSDAERRWLPFVEFLRVRRAALAEALAAPGGKPAVVTSLGLPARLLPQLDSYLPTDPAPLLLGSHWAGEPDRVQAGGGCLRAGAALWRPPTTAPCLLHNDVTADNVLVVAPAVLRQAVDRDVAADSSSSRGVNSKACRGGSTAGLTDGHSHSHSSEVCDGETPNHVALRLLDFGDAGHGDPLFDFLAVAGSCLKCDVMLLAAAWTAYRSVGAPGALKALWPPGRGAANAVSATDNIQSSGSWCVTGTAGSSCGSSPHNRGDSTNGSCVPLSRVALCYSLLYEDEGLLHVLRRSMTCDVSQPTCWLDGAASLDEVASAAWGFLDVPW